MELLKLKSKFLLPQTTLRQFITGGLFRSEFENSVRQSLDATQLHNALIISLFDTSHRRLPRKCRRTLPYQGPITPDEALRSAKLKRWTVSVGKRGHEHIRMLQNVPPLMELPRPRKDTDEVARERCRAPY
jgi:hypothetical protein